MPKRTWYEIKNLSPETTDVFMYDEIGGWGMSAGDFIKDIRATKGHLTMHVNSPGGSIFEGLAIYNALVERDVTMIVEGVAASMASAIVMAGKKVIMHDNATMMIHKPWTQLCGTADDLKKAAGILDAMEAKLVDIYVTGTGLPATQVKDMMSAETWLDAKQALKLGFCDEIKAGVRTDNKQIITFERSEKMDEILKLLGVASEDLAVAKVKGLLTSIEAMLATQKELENEIAIQSKALNQSIIQNDIQNKKLLPAQKDLAEKLIATDRKLYDEFVQSLHTPDLTKHIKLEATQPKSITYQTLLDDAELHAKMLKENPTQVEELEKEWRKNVR